LWTMMICAILPMAAGPGVAISASGVGVSRLGAGAPPNAGVGTPIRGGLALFAGFGGSGVGATLGIGLTFGVGFRGGGAAGPCTGPCASAGTRPPQTNPKDANRAQAVFCTCARFFTATVKRLSPLMLLGGAALMGINLQMRKYGSIR
jgi:hypothetical protein